MRIKKQKSGDVKLSKAEPVAPPPPDVAPYWAFFFRDQRAPLVRSQTVTALMAGRQFEVERLPACALLDVVMLGFAARAFHDAEVVDDWNALLRRTDTLWSEPNWTCKVFDQTHSGTASFIVRGVDRLACPEDQYIPGLVGWLLEHDPPEYFSEELS